jgi:hypothetical protein
VITDDEGHIAHVAESLTITGENGESVTVSPSDYPETIRAALALHGLKQVHGDNFAGRDAPDALALCEKRAEHHKANQWAGGGGGGDGISQADKDLAAAIAKVAEAKGLDLGADFGPAVVADWGKEKKAAKRKMPPVAVELELIRKARQDAKLKAKKAAAKADTGEIDLL